MRQSQSSYQFYAAVTEQAARGLGRTIEINGLAGILYHHGIKAQVYRVFCRIAYAIIEGEANTEKSW